MTRIDKENYEAQLAAMRAEIEELRKHKEGALSSADEMMVMLKEHGITVADDLKQKITQIKRGHVRSDPSFLRRLVLLPRRSLVLLLLRFVPPPPQRLATCVLVCWSRSLGPLQIVNTTQYTSNCSGSTAI